MNLPFTKKEVLLAVVFIILYILLGNARSARPNPFIPGAVITISIIVPIIAGLIKGKRMGTIVGITATALNTLTPAGGLLNGSLYELLAVIPHGLMGYIAGKYREEISTILVAGSALAAGTILHIALLLIFLKLSLSTIAESTFIIGTLLEVGLTTVIAIIFYYIYRIGFIHGTDN